MMAFQESVQAWLCPNWTATGVRSGLKPLPSSLASRMFTVCETGRPDWVVPCSILVQGFFAASYNKGGGSVLLLDIVALGSNIELSS